MTKIHSIICCCGNGIGSSILMELNLRKALVKLGRKDVAVGHACLTDIGESEYDLIVTGEEMIDEVRRFPRVIIMQRLISEQELTEKLKKAFLEDRDVFVIR